MIKHYFQTLPMGILTLWCYVIWYVVMATYYFKADFALWRNSIGLSLIVGIALVLATGPISLERIQKNSWQVIRLFLCPFFVSSFSSLTQGKGFLLLISPIFEENLLAFNLCFFFCALVYSIKRLPFN